MKYQFSHHLNAQRNSDPRFHRHHAQLKWPSPYYLHYNGWLFWSVGKSLEGEKVWVSEAWRMSQSLINFLRIICRHMVGFPFFFLFRDSSFGTVTSSDQGRFCGQFFEAWIFFTVKVLNDYCYSFKCTAKGWIGANCYNVNSYRRVYSTHHVFLSVLSVEKV